MEMIYLQYLIATIITLGFLLVSGRPAILLSLLILLCSLVLFQGDESEQRYIYMYCAALALLPFGDFFRRVGPPVTQPTVMNVTNRSCITDMNGASYLRMIRSAEEEAKEKRSRQLEEWRRSRSERQ